MQLKKSIKSVGIYVACYESSEEDLNGERAKEIAERIRLGELLDSTHA